MACRVAGAADPAIPGDVAPNKSEWEIVGLQTKRCKAGGGRQGACCAGEQLLTSGQSSLLLAQRQVSPQPQAASLSSPEVSWVVYVFGHRQTSRNSSAPLL